MSDDVNVHLGLEPNSKYNTLEMFGNVLECVAIPQHSDDGRRLNRFEHIKVYDASFSRVVLDEPIATNEVSKVLMKLESYTGPKFHYEIASAFDCFRFENEKKQLEPWIKPLTINYYGSEHGWKGLEYKSYGPVRLDFSNTKAFRVAQTLIDHVKVIAESGGDTTKGLKMIAKLGRNFEAVSGLAKRVISKLNPLHLLVCTDLEVHPLTAHAIYHRNWQDYLEDLKKIARLHEHGGVYFYDVTLDEPAFSNPRKSPPDYGYLRGQYGDGTEEDFVEQLQPMVNAILLNPERVRISRDQIEECFFSLGFTEVEKLNDSYYLSAIDAPFAYLEEPYFRLYESAYNSSPFSTQNFR